MSSSALGDSQMAEMSSTSSTYESEKERVLIERVGEGQGAAGKPFFSSSVLQHNH